MPLKGISPILSPDLLHALASMGHGDVLVLADTHFPTTSICKNGTAREIRLDGVRIPKLLSAILDLFPLDQYADFPVALMKKVDRDVDLAVPIWTTYRDLLYLKGGLKSKKGGDRFDLEEEFIAKFDRDVFYKAAKTAYVIVHTGETAQYGNIMLQKGVVMGL